MQTALKMVQGGLHFGGALQHLVSKYPTLLAVLKEQVQNSIDKKAKNILVRVDFDRREVEHLDNGEGADKTFSEKALGSIGQSTKKEDQYGRFGIGLVAPLSVCEKYTFTSATAEQPYYMMWTFDRKRLFEATDRFDFPCVVRDGLFKVVNGKKNKDSQAVWWSTQVLMRGLTEDKRKTELNLEDLSNQIENEYSKKMLELDIVVKVVVIRSGKEEEKVIRGKDFYGKKLSLWEYPSAFGKVSVQMYLSPPGTSGAVRIRIAAADDLFRLTWQRFSASAGYKYLGEETKVALGSGVFQGEIVGEGLKLSSTRRSFDDSDALMALGVALDEWYEQVGNKFLSDEKGKQARERYQDLGKEVINSLSWMFEGSDSVFSRVISQAVYGSVGKGHAPQKGTVVDGYTMNGAVTQSGDKTDFTHSNVNRKDPEKDKPKHMPKVSIGPNGSERTVVKGHSKGPHILFSDFDGSSSLWAFDPASLCLQINITHPSFVVVEKSDYKVKALTEQIFLTAFQLEVQPSDYRMHAEKFASEMLNGFVELLKKGTIARKFGGK